MIFLVVGTQEPFDRLVKSVDKWAGKSGYKDIYGQISRAGYLPVNFEFTDFIAPELFDEKFLSADLIIGHAGMGTIIQALQYYKPIIVMPRLSLYHETRNDHQFSTAKSFSRMGYVKDVYTEDELFAALDSAGNIKPSQPIGLSASQSLLNCISDFIKS